MKCPVCNLDLVMTERQGVEIDYCQKCHGVWLDRGELDKIIERSTSEMPQRQSAPANYGHQSGKHHEHGHDEHHYKKKGGFLSELFD
jgi:Zn-finger nucleic acid-binding protein